MKKTKNIKPQRGKEAAALRESQARFRQTLEAAPIAMVMVNPVGKIVLVNALAEKLFGYSHKELLGETVELLVPERFRSSHRTDRKAFFAESRARAMGAGRDLYGRRKDGGEFPIEIGLTPVETAEGTCVLSTVVDITERKSAEEALRKSAARFHDLYENAPDMFVSVDAATGKIIQCNQTLVAALGYSKVQLVGRHISFVYHPDCEQYRQEVFRTFVETGEVREAELQLKRKDGSKIEVSLNVTAVRDEQGHVLYSRSIWRDITRRKQAEEALRRTHEELEARVAERTASLAEANAQLKAEITERKRAEVALRESELQIRLAMDALPVLISYIDQEQCYRLNNKAYEQWFGVPREGIVGRHIRDVLGPTAYQAVQPYIETALRGEQVSFENWVPYKDGGTRYVSATYVPHLGEQGQQRGFFVVASDNTERKRLEEQLHQASRMEAVGQLAGGVAHDFNNLLTVVKGYSELALLRLTPEDPLHPLIEEIKKAGEMASSLTYHLLAFSRQQVSQPREVWLNALVANLTGMLHRLLGEDVRLTTNLAPSLGLVKADPSQLEQVIVNLAVNARDAMPEGGTLTIQTANVQPARPDPRGQSPVHPGPAVCLIVRDTGHGMDAATRARIFEPFFTTKEPGRGTGLGLATVYGIVTQSGWTIEVDSAPGQGTTFTLTLPQFEAAHLAVAAPDVPAGLAAGTGTILLVEDQAPVRGLVQKVLTAAGYEVLEAAQSEEAQRLCSSHAGPIHLLLTDMVMPEMSGRRLAELVTDLRPQIKVLFMSGYVDDPRMRLHLAEGRIPLIQKPFTPQALTHAVRGVLAT